MHEVEQREETVEDSDNHFQWDEREEKGPVKIMRIYVINFLMLRFTYHLK